MTAHYLDKMFNPHSVAVIGASEREGSVGAKLITNLLQSHYQGKIYPVNPKYKVVQGLSCVASVQEIKDTVDLAVISTPPQTIPDILCQCGEYKIKGVLILTAGFAETGSHGVELEHSLLDIVRKYQIRMVGPNCLGIMRPAINLNATFSNTSALPGNLALVSQSGAICVAISDWAVQHRIGFSALVSMGNAIDVDFGDVLDYLALDTQTKSILLYIESVRNARHFLSGLRAASRLKPVIVIKAGRYAQGSKAALSHTGALIGNDDVFDTALRRGGALRVNTIEQLFNAAEILSSNNRTKGNRLAIVTNGGGAGVMAVDRAAECHIETPELSPTTFAYLNTILPSAWSHHNPIDILGDATPLRYQQAIKACLEDKNVDGLLTILLPVAMSEPDKVAAEVIEISKGSDKPVLACWMGYDQVKLSWELFAKNNCAYFETPESAVEAFSYLADYYLNQQLLLQVPDPLVLTTKPDVEGARLIIEQALKQQRKILTSIESKAILAAFGIPVTQTIAAHSMDEAVVVAESIGFPIVMKILSHEISHKQEVGGVQLNITHAEGVRKTYQEMIAKAQKLRPDAKILGVSIEKMYKNPNDRELMIGMIYDIIFGPVISFGAGGSLVEVMQDRALALPPLNSFIINRLIQQTKVAKLLKPFRGMPAIHLAAVETILLRISEMICELPTIKEMDINPLIANEKEAIAVDARIVVDYPSVTTQIPYGHMAIHPYPRHLVSSLQTADGIPITIRPIRPEDAKLEQEFTKHLSEHAKYLRFWAHLQELTPEILLRFTQIDYDREMALIAVYEENSKENCLGITQYTINPDQESCEFAIVIDDHWQNKGIGSQLLIKLIEVAKTKNLKVMVGEVMASNTKMLELVKHLGFDIKSSVDNDSKIVIKKLC